MKPFTNKIKRFLLLGMVLVSAASGLMAQGLDPAAVRKLIDSKHFVFKAQTVQPQGAASRQLTSDYDVKISGDTLISYLPYFGRAYVPVLPGEGGGFDFTSTDFQYKAKEKKKGGWEITILPKDAKDVRQLSLNISANGYAYLQVTSNTRQSISYNGFITERK